MTPCPGRQAGEANGTDANTGQMNDGMADSRHHAPHLAVAALKNSQFYFGQASLARFWRGTCHADAFGGLRRAVFQNNAAP